jgi:hypothetical protein
MKAVIGHVFVGGIRGAELATVNLKGERSVVQQAE